MPVQLATLCYVKQAGQTLMMHRIKKARDVHAGKWCGLGGKFETGEDPEACVCREVREEAGLELHAPELKGLLTLPRFKDGVDWYVFVFVARQFRGELGTCAEGELAWIPDDQVCRLNLWEGDPEFIRLLDRDLFFSGTYLYVDGRLESSRLRTYPLAAAKGFLS